MFNLHSANGFYIQSTFSKGNLPSIYVHWTWIEHSYLSGLLHRSLDCVSILHSQCTFSTPWGAFRTVTNVQVCPCQVNNIFCILPGSNVYNWVKSSNVNNVSWWREKSTGWWWELNPGPQSESQALTPIYHSTSIIKTLYHKARRSGTHAEVAFFFF